MTVPSQSSRLRPFRSTAFGRYTLLSPLATGGMGEIFLARLDGLQGVEKLCVIKKILPHLSSDTDFVERFVNEAKILVKLAHGSIAQVLDVGLHEGDPFIALEYVDGKDLRKVAARARDRGVPLPLTFVLFVMARVLDALAYAHRKKDDEDKELDLVHRDVSPQNILISYEGEVKVIDFGLAKSTLNISKTHPSIILGKFLYMSPEQARHETVDRRSDLYSVGLCLYELITGKNPFEDVPPGELMAHVASPAIAPIGQVDPLCPGSVQDLVTRALQPDPAKRFQTAEELRGKLTASLLEIDPSSGPEGVARYMREAFAAEHQTERKLLTTLRDANRVASRVGPAPRRPSPSEDETAVVNLSSLAKQSTAPTNPALRAVTVPRLPSSFVPTPRAKEDPGRVIPPDQPTTPGVHLSEAQLPTADVPRPAAVALVPFEEPKTDTDLPAAPAATDTQPGVIVGSLVETPPVLPPPPVLRPPAAATPEPPVLEKKEPRRPRPRWIWPAALLLTLGVIGGAGYFALHDWIAGLFQNTDPGPPHALTVHVSKGGGKSEDVQPPLVAKIPVSPPLPGPPVTGGGGSPDEKAPSSPGDDLLSELPSGPARPSAGKHGKRPPPNDPFFRQWERTKHDFVTLTHKHPCDDAAVRMLCTRFDDVKSKIDETGDEAGKHPELRLLLDKLELDIRRAER
jgi:serine/threonine protein kinase